MPLRPLGRPRPDGEGVDFFVSMASVWKAMVLVALYNDFDVDII